MLYAIGSKVRFKHTGDEGIITRRLDNGMVEVALDGDLEMTIPIFPDDLERVVDLMNPSKTKAKIVSGKKDKTPTPPPRPSIESQYAVIKSQGIQVAFDPVDLKNSIPERYEVYLLNDLKADYIFTYHLKIAEAAKEKHNGKLSSMTAEMVGELWYDELSDNPEIQLELWKVTTKGTGTRHYKSLKIKPKQFFQRIKTAPFLNRKVHLYPAFDGKEPTTAQKKKNNLLEYTRQNLKPTIGTPAYVRYQTHDVKAFAEFNPEIDLHIENLVSHSIKGMSNSQIIRIQLDHFERFMEKAIRLGVAYIFVIHGLGKGRLRDEVATRLVRHPDVKSFKNEYHPKYGWGATEVRF
ncbi:MAG: Smr/MutS family protein [Saprospiraceae bacterium]